MGSQGGTQKLQLIDSHGEFREQELREFVSAAQVDSSSDYLVVAIMGPQSSGKSTLVNHVFGTDFVMMDAMAGRQQTTMGVWLSKAPKIPEHLTLVMDLEGSDGRERGEDDTNFERQSALFALAVADVLMVNIWSIEIGREHGSGKPLLRTIFQVNLKLFAPDPNRKRTVLLFVIRDKTKTPLPKLIEVMEDDLGKMWAAIAKPPQYENSSIRDFFDVQYAAMSHYEEKYDDFLVDAAILRRRFQPDEEGTLVRQNEHLPGAAFALSSQKIWEAIRTQKDLNLPAHKVMVANIRCAEIASDQLSAFVMDQAWKDLEAEARSGTGEVVRGFNTRLMGLIDSCIQGYEADAMYFDHKVRDAKRDELNTKLWDVVKPAVQDQVSALHNQQLSAALKELQLATGSDRDSAAASTHASAPASAQQASTQDNSNTSNASSSGSGVSGGGAAGVSGSPVPFAAAARATHTAAVANFKRAFAEDLQMEGTEWDGRAAAAKFEEDLAARIGGLREERINDAVQAVQRQLASALSGPVISLLDSCTSGVWQRLHAAARNAAGSTERSLMRQLEGYELTPEEQQALGERLAGMARAKLENHMREAALTRLSRMRDRFSEVFTLDEHKTPRMWRSSDKIPVLAHNARLAAAQVLAQLAVVRPPEGSLSSSKEGSPDIVESAVLEMAKADLEGNTASAAAMDILSADSWPGVPEEDVLLQPHEIRTTWREFMSASNVMVQQALTAQQTASMAGSRPPPFWAILAILLLGWNEFMSLLYNPLYLVLGLLAFLFVRTLYSELDVDAEMQKGTLPGFMSLLAKLKPASIAVLHRCAEAASALAAGHMPAQLQPQGNGIGSETELSRSMRSSAETANNFGSSGYANSSSHSGPSAHGHSHGAGGYGASSSSTGEGRFGGGAAGDGGASNLRRRGPGGQGGGDRNVR